MNSAAMYTLTTLTSCWLSFPAYRSTFLQQRLLNPISAHATMVTFLTTYRSFNLRTYLFTDFHGFLDQRSPISSARFVLKPYNKLLISTLSANIKSKFSHRVRPSRTLQIRVPLCLFVSTKSVPKHTRRLAVSVFNLFPVLVFRASQGLWVLTTLNAVTDQTDTLSCIHSKIRRLSRTKAAASHRSTPDQSTAPFTNSHEIPKPTSLDAVQPLFEALPSPQTQKLHRTPRVTHQLPQAPKVFPSRGQYRNTNLSSNHVTTTGGGIRGVLQTNARLQHARINSHARLFSHNNAQAKILGAKLGHSHHNAKQPRLDESENSRNESQKLVAEDSLVEKSPQMLNTVTRIQMFVMLFCKTKFS